MESPVRSVETTTGSGENGGGGGKEDSGAEPSSQRFEAKSYLERQVEELSCADEDEAQEKVSQRLELKQERAKQKRCERKDKERSSESKSACVFGFFSPHVLCACCSSSRFFYFA